MASSSARMLRSSREFKIGKFATIGAGAVVIQDVPDYAVVVGNPARIVKENPRELEHGDVYAD